VRVDECEEVALLQHRLQAVRRVVAVHPEAAELGRLGGQRTSRAKDGRALPGIEARGQQPDQTVLRAVFRKADHFAVGEIGEHRGELLSFPTVDLVSPQIPRPASRAVTVPLGEKRVRGTTGLAPTDAVTHGRMRGRRRLTIQTNDLAQSTRDRLTLFLRQAGAPLDNKIVERALKKAILHRKNALFYKTPTGAKVGDLFMSLIDTSELAGSKPFDYLTALRRHAADLATRPQSWMPWNHTETCAPLSAPSRNQ
jgi:hypothetical protein